MIGDTVTVELYLNSAWADITTYVRATESDGIRITFGIQNETGTADPAECRLTVTNADGRFTPRNAEGPYYGHLKRNTPLRVTVDGAVRYVGEVSEFPSLWDPSGKDVWVPLVASGPLRRLERYSALQSPFATYIPTKGSDVGGHVIGYWPTEDAAGSTQFASGLPGGAPLSIISGTPNYAAVEPGVAGSGPIAGWEGVAAGANLTGGGGSDEFTVGFLLSVPESGTTDEAELIAFYTSGTAKLWRILYDSTGTGQLRLVVWENNAGVVTETFNTSYSWSGGINGVTRYIKLEVQQDGADADFAFSSIPGGTYFGTVTTAVVAGPYGIVVGRSANLAGDVGIGHVVVADTHDALINPNFDDAMLGYAGESVEDRFTRVTALIGVNSAILTSGTVDSMTLGPQPITDPLSILRDGEAADGGILRDSLNEINGLVYVTRRAIYTGTPVLELDYAAGHLSPPLEPVDDDALLSNDVIVTRTGGGSSRATDLTSPLNANNYPDGVGTYQKAVTLNVETDGQTADMASWLLSLGTLDKPRFPKVTVDLVANPSLTADVDADLRPGRYITIVNLPDWAAQGPVHLICRGWTETITAARRTFVLNCAPANGYDVVRLDDTQYGRIDSDTTTLNEALDTTETGVDYTGGAWVTTATHPGDFPFVIEVGGEQMTVTAATATTFTVTRSTNGVVKTHTAGTPVRLARPNRIAL